MFGLGKRRAEREAYASVRRVVLMLLTEEKYRVEAAVGQFVLQSKDGRLNNLALGYVFGVVDSALQNAGLKLKNFRGTSIVMDVFEAFEPGSGPRYFEHLCNVMESSPVMMEGVHKGFAQFNQYVTERGRWGLNGLLDCVSSMANRP